MIIFNPLDLVLKCICSDYLSDAVNKVKKTN